MHWKFHSITRVSSTLSYLLCDTDLSEWALVEGITTPLKDPIGGKKYDVGASTYKCLYDDERIYFAMTIPGFYKFSTEDNHMCAALATMTKIGSAATFYNMGGCAEPDALMDGCNATTIDMCADHLVDIGAHWELRTTTQGTMYDIGLANPGATSSTSSAVQAQELLPTGDDAIANKDDEYGVSPYCRFDDNDDKAGNEWAGAWKHTKSVDGELGDYIFEMSRLLTTASTKTDAQIQAGGTIEFGISFWDPMQTESGWTDAGHYVTGCGTKWISLKLTETSPQDKTPEAETSGVMTLYSMRAAIAAALTALVF